MFSEDQGNHLDSQTTLAKWAAGIAMCPRRMYPESKWSLMHNSSRWLWALGRNVPNRMLTSSWQGSNAASAWPVSIWLKQQTAGLECEACWLHPLKLDPRHTSRPFFACCKAAFWPISAFHLDMAKWKLCHLLTIWLYLSSANGSLFNYDDDNTIYADNDQTDSVFAPNFYDDNNNNNDDSEVCKFLSQFNASCIKMMTEMNDFLETAQQIRNFWLILMKCST